MTELVRRSETEIHAHPARVISRVFEPGHEGLIAGRSRAHAVISRVLHMTNDEVSRTLADTLALYSNRHDDLRASFRRNFEIVTQGDWLGQQDCTQDRIDLIGAYFTQEYSIEGAALFNPSIVPAPDQSGCADGELRFILSLRAVGEGHVSSIEFRSGCIGPNDTVTLDLASPRLSTGEIQQLTGSAYQRVFSPTSTLSERVLFPAMAHESRGLEDARLVQFTENDGSTTYFATYTAYDGSHVAPYLLHTDDFLTFHTQPMMGAAARNKGMALFPRRINGVMWCISRWDRENLSVACLADGLEWHDPQVIQVPAAAWELVQLGACSSPIETAEGWLVLTHGVGPMRTYAMGALLLALEDPSKVLGVLREPLLVPAETERNGYVPNVVYSCGALVHNDVLVLPYGCSDASVRFAFVDLPELLTHLVSTSQGAGTESA